MIYILVNEIKLYDDKFLHIISKDDQNCKVKIIDGMNTKKQLNSSFNYTYLTFDKSGKFFNKKNLFLKSEENNDWLKSDNKRLVEHLDNCNVFSSSQHFLIVDSKENSELYQRLMYNKISSFELPKNRKKEEEPNKDKNDNTIKNNQKLNNTVKSNTDSISYSTGNLFNSTKTVPIKGHVKFKDQINEEIEKINEITKKNDSIETLTTNENNTHNENSESNSRLNKLIHSLNSLVNKTDVQSNYGKEIVEKIDYSKFSSLEELYMESRRFFLFKNVREFDINKLKSDLVSINPTFLTQAINLNKTKSQLFSDQVNIVFNKHVVKYMPYYLAFKWNNYRSALIRELMKFYEKTISKVEFKLIDLPNELTHKTSFRRCYHKEFKFYTNILKSKILLETMFCFFNISKIDNNNYIFLDDENNLIIRFTLLNSSHNSGSITIIQNSERDNSQIYLFWIYFLNLVIEQLIRVYEIIDLVFVGIAN